VSLTVCDLVQTIAETLIENATGNERQLLSKSLQEALFYSLGHNIDLTSTQVKTRLKRFLRRHNKGAFIQRFLSLYFFNLIWFYTEEWLSDEADTPQMCQEEITALDRICKRAVFAAYKHVDVLDESAAEQLIRNIQQRLTIVSCGSNPAVHQGTIPVQESDWSHSSVAD
jgi:hypothetical protein